MLDDLLFTLEICEKYLPVDAHPAHRERLQQIKEMLRRWLGR